MRSTREWFISRNGQVQGPLSTAGIRDRLSQGDLTPLDQICQAGGASDLQWKLIFECPEFIQPATTPNAGAHSTSGAQGEWVLLRQTTTGQFSLKRSGPYTTDDIALMLRENSITFADYVWKKGFQRWAQLETLRDFNHSLPAEPPKLELVRTASSASSPPALEASPNFEPSADDTETFVMTSPTLPSLVSEPITQEELNTLRASRKAGAEPKVGASIWARVAIAFIISMGVMLALVSLKPFKKTRSAQKASRIAEPEGYLTIMPLDMETHPKLEFDMSAAPKTFLQVQIIGHDGQILHRIRFAQTLTLQKKGNEAPVLDLSPLGLPDGTYEISASDGQIKTTQQIFMGQHTAQFDRDLAAHQKDIARAQLVERRAVYDMAAHLSALLDRLPAATDVASGSWSEHFATWMSDFQKLTRSASLNQAAAQSAEPALLQAAQGVTKSIHEQAVALDTSIKSNSAETPKSIGATALKSQLRRLQVQASGSNR